MEIRPQPKQELFLASPADIAIYGGAAGGGKTWALLLEPLRHIDNPGFRAVVFRRTYPEHTLAGGPWEETFNLYPHLGGRATEDDLTWTFPSGATISFGHMQHEESKARYRGAQITLLLWDQLETFSEGQFWYLLSRNRSVCGIRPYVRATCNPDPDSWLASFLAWWIDEETGYPIEGRAGVLRWMVRLGGRIVWADSREELVERYGVRPDRPKSVTFIPARLDDNPALERRDPGYRGNLEALDEVERERLLRGNWRVRPAAGKLFNRAWFEVVEAVPAGGRMVRFWDLAATRPELRGEDPDFTAGVLMARVEGAFYILDVTAIQAGPAEVEQVICRVAKQDAALARETGRQYTVAWEVEPGSAAKRESLRLVRKLTGLHAVGVPVRGDKVTRARPLAAQALAGNVKLARGSWNEEFLTHMHGQPDLRHDDICDASAGAFALLAVVRRPRPVRAVMRRE